MQRKELDLATLSFREFKHEFYERVTDFTVFDCADFNLLKVVLDGLKVNYVRKFGARRLESAFTHNLKNFARRRKYSKIIRDAKHKIAATHLDKPCIVYEPGRIISDGNGAACSQYFFHLLKDLGETAAVIILENPNSGALMHNFEVTDVNNAAGYEPLLPKELELLGNLRKSLISIKQANLFSTSELLNIETAFSKFFLQYKTWSRFFAITSLSAKKFIFTCHYHKEGLLYALKKAGIESIELQHGLIAREDIFYVFPKSIQAVAPKALFPDRIVVFGDYWKTVLLEGAEFLPNQITVGGYFPFHDFSSFEKQLSDLRTLFNGQTVLLVTTQTFMDRFYIEYVKSLEQKIVGTNRRIIIKPHPAEDINVYLSAFKSSANVSVLTYPTEVLFRIANLHLSVYSTTLYDCLKHQIPNFSLHVNQYSDYVAAIYKQGVASPIEWSENPFEKMQSFTGDDNLSEKFFRKYDGPDFIEV